MEMSTELKEKYNSHIGSDVEYPASCEAIVTACNGMSEFSADEKAWFSKTLPHGTYSSAADVSKAVGL